MPTWFHCDSTSGAVVSAGLASADDAAAHTAPAGQSLVIVPDGLVGNPFAGSPEISGLAAHLRTAVDEAAELARAQFITPGAGQAMTYLAKQAEAAAYLADAAAPTPFLTAEAAATSTTVAALAPVVHARALAWTTAGARIEAARMAAKAAIAAATTVGHLASAAAVDWAAVVAG